VFQCDNRFVRNEGIGQQLCLNRDSFCVRRRHKSLCRNARCDNFYVAHHLVVSDIKVVISDTNLVTFGHKSCHTHHPKGRVGGAGVTRLSLPNIPFCARERRFLVGRSPAPIANRSRTSAATPRTGDHEARDSDASRTWAAQRVAAVTGSQAPSRSFSCAASVIARWQADLLLEGYGHVLIVLKPYARGDD
jgi:hypothetical protein